MKKHGVGGVSAWTSSIPHPPEAAVMRSRSPLLLAPLFALLGCPSDGGVKVYHSPPRAAIVAPEDDQAFDAGDAIAFEGRVDDDRDASTDLQIVWTSDRDGELNIEPPDADGVVRFATTLTPGTHVVTLQVTNSQALTGEDYVTLTVSDAALEPEITVRRPRAGDYGVEGVAFTFEALVADAQDAAPDLTVWLASDVDGTFCEPVPDADGLVSCDATLSPGDHTLTFGVVDVDGNEVTTDALFTVVAGDASDDDSDGYTEAQNDCDDTDPSVHPGATEYPNGVDDDCDGTTDEGTTNVDDDGDGFTEGDGDCDDGDVDSYPGGLEVCDGRDNDCDLTVDDGTACIDDDGDGFTDNDGDCDDTDVASHPGASEIGDGADNDCDGTADEGTTVYDDDGDCACEAGPCTGSAEAGCTTLTDGDCDDAVATINPNAAETCNHVDDDCDGTADESAVDAVTWYADTDGDLYGDASVTSVGCDAPAGYVARGTDCDDTDATTSPAASETCDGFDDDCDGTVDESEAIDAPTWYRDADGDSYGLATSTTRACTAPSGWVASNTDCNDANAAVSPAASEVCDSADNNCDGATDESSAVDATIWWVDADGDGYGGPSTSTVSCTRPGGYASTFTDCNDSSAAVSPAAVETCNSTDDDCDGTADEGVTTTYYRDADGDGYGDASTTTTACSAPSGYVSDSSDCNDASAGTSPATTWYRDSDGDGYGDSTATRTACTQPSGYVASSTDCNDATSNAYPGRSERCDSIDNDCDGYTDEMNASGCSTYYLDSDGDGYGTTTSRCYCSATGSYTSSNNDDCYDSNANANPAATAYYTTDRGDGSYDYNCDGSSTKRYTATYECTGAVFVCVDSSDGWTGSAPSCGSSSRWGTSCSADLTSCTYGSSSSRTQSCR